MIYYASSILNDAQLSYSTTGKEFLSVVFTLEKFLFYSIGSVITMYTDYTVLRHLLECKSETDSMDTLTLRV